MRPLVLASTSRYRAALLDRLGIPYAVDAPGVDEAARPGDVIVIDAQSFLEAVMWGEIYSLMAMERGIAGTVVDGAVRDVSPTRSPLPQPPRSGGAEQRSMF